MTQSTGITKKVFTNATPTDTIPTYNQFKSYYFLSFPEYEYAIYLKYSVAPRKVTHDIICFQNTGAIPSNKLFTGNVVKNDLIPFYLRWAVISQTFILSNGHMNATSIAAILNPQSIPEAVRDKVSPKTLLKNPSNDICKGQR